MTSPQSEAEDAEAIEVVAKAIYGSKSVLDDETNRYWAIKEARAALSAAKPHIEKALLKRMMNNDAAIMEICDRFRGDGSFCGEAAREFLVVIIHAIARDLGYGDIGE